MSLDSLLFVVLAAGSMLAVATLFAGFKDSSDRRKHAERLLATYRAAA